MKQLLFLLLITTAFSCKGKIKYIPLKIEHHYDTVKVPITRTMVEITYVDSVDLKELNIDTTQPYSLHGSWSEGKTVPFSIDPLRDTITKHIIVYYNK